MAGFEELARRHAPNEKATITEYRIDIRRGMEHVATVRIEVSDKNGPFSVSGKARQWQAGLLEALDHEFNREFPTRDGLLFGDLVTLEFMACEARLE